MSGEPNVIPFDLENYLETARERVTFAFEDAPVFDKYLQLLTGPQMELQLAMQDLMQKRSIDTAKGAALDIIGNIVGQDRVLVGADIIPYFGYDGALAAQSYGDLFNPAVGGFYWDMNQALAGNITMNDDQYRLFIKAKIMKNLTHSTPEDVIKFIQFVFDVEKVYISLDQDAHAIVFVSDDIDLFERALLTYYTQRQFKSYFVPKTIGVRYDFGMFDPDEFFAFQGVPGAKGFGNLIPVGNVLDGSFFLDGSVLLNEDRGMILEPGVGGKFATIFSQ